MNTRRDVGESSSVKEYTPNGIDFPPFYRRLGYRLGKWTLNYSLRRGPTAAGQRTQPCSSRPQSGQRVERYFPTLHGTIARSVAPETIQQREEQSHRKVFAPPGKRLDCYGH